MDFIHRLQPTSDDSPPWTGISFKHEVDSDDLASQLKIRYSDLRTHRERKHRATIDFLLQELGSMRTKDPSTPNAFNSDLQPSSKRQDESKVYIEINSDRSRPQSASSYTSPSVSGSLHSPAISDRAMPSSSTKDSIPMPSSFNASSQQLVWNSQTGKTMRPKTKRKMTVEERRAYKKTREQGACESCRKQKARCTHAMAGEMLPIQLNSPNITTKRKSLGSASDRPRKKAIKDEPLSEPSQLIFPEPPPPRRDSAPALRNNHISVHDAAGSAMRLSGDGEQWANGYVPPGQPMGYFDDPWSPYTARSPVVPLPVTYAGDSCMTTQSFAPGMVPMHPSDFSLSTPLQYYEPQTWTDDPNLNNMDPT